VDCFPVSRITSVTLTSARCPDSDILDLVRRLGSEGCQDPGACRPKVSRDFVSVGDPTGGKAHPLYQISQPRIARNMVELRGEKVGDSQFLK
jgi:hypothetical protein